MRLLCLKCVFNYVVDTADDENTVPVKRDVVQYLKLIVQVKRFFSLLDAGQILAYLKEGQRR